VDTFTIVAVDPDADYTEGIVATMHGVTRGEALARGCEAIVDGYIGVRVVGTFSHWALVDPSAPRLTATPVAVA